MLIIISWGEERKTRTGRNEYENQTLNIHQAAMSGMPDGAFAG
jgi:hypothetical protein